MTKEWTENKIEQQLSAKLQTFKENTQVETKLAEMQKLFSSTLTSFEIG